MLSRVSATLLRRCGRPSEPLLRLRRSTPETTAAEVLPPPSRHRARSYGGDSRVERQPTADDAWATSCYNEIDYTISEDDTVYEAVRRFSAFGIGCLVTVDADGHISGVISERDYVNKIALLGRKSRETKVREISTKSANLVTASPGDTVDACMGKMLSKDIRHLPLLDDDGRVCGILSIKDLVKSVVKEKERTIKILADFALGKGGH